MNNGNSVVRSVSNSVTVFDESAKGCKYCKEVVFNTRKVTSKDLLKTFKNPALSCLGGLNTSKLQCF